MNRHKRPVSALYVHVPFCSGKCFYCDFYSMAGPDQEAIRCWHRGILWELSRLSQEAAVHGLIIHPLQTIYFGGGTPSFVPPHMIVSVIEHASDLFSLADNCDITLEGNPESVNKDALATWKKAGVNRLSVGLQTASDPLLKLIGRRHTAKEAKEAIVLAFETGFSHIAVDLMTGLPDQRLADVEATLAFIEKLPIDHVSSYALDIACRTPFHTMWEKTPWHFPDDEEERAMNALVIRQLKALGFHHYEISNFAKSGAESRHNLTYWHGDGYLGVGPSAASFMAGIRRKNPESLEAWLTLVHDHEQGPFGADTIEETIDEEAARVETMVLGLRLMEGVSFDAFYERHGLGMEECFGKTLRELEIQGLLVKDQGGVRLSEKGLDFADAAVRAFL